MVVVVAIGASDQTRLVDEGAALADAFDDELHVMHILDIDITGKDIGTTTQKSEQQLREVAAQRASDAASELSRDFEAVGLLDERVSGTIADYAEKHDARYLVVGGRKRSPTGKAIFGSTTQSILLNATCPVLTVMQR